MITDIVFQLLFILLRLYTWALILAALVSTLLAFGVLDRRNRLVWTVGDFLERVTEPALRPIRRALPLMGGIDLSPLVALLLLQVVVTPLLGSLYAGIRTGVWQPLF
ncbi:MAG TPA: YggT family protein [Acetobacteraceae bacterium]|nr:YggT family protein [Acetobacteraceae bacterium]